MGLFGWSVGEAERSMIYSKGQSAARRSTKRHIDECFSPKKLKRIAKETSFSDLRELASCRADFLSGLSHRERKRLQKELDEQKNVQKIRQQQFEEKAEDPESLEHWIKELYEHYARENDTGREKIEQHLSWYGDDAYPHVKEYIFTLALQYQEYTENIREINYATEEGNKTRAIIEAYRNGLYYGICFLAMFGHPDRIGDIASFYRFIHQKVYSDPHGGFGDMFKAVDIRRHAVRAMGLATKDHTENVPFYLEALDDESRFVRWEVIDILKDRWTPGEIAAHTSLCRALERALTQEDNGFSNRKKKIAYLLEDNMLTKGSDSAKEPVGRSAPQDSEEARERIEKKADEEFNMLTKGSGSAAAVDIEKADVGSIIEFGFYPQDRQGKTAPIEWQVLAKEEGRILVISKYGLDRQKYNTSRANVTWETCSLRKWLNETFLTSAFSAEERDMIPVVTVNADENPEHDTNPGDSTMDQVFLLSIKEVNEYFCSQDTRECEGTDYFFAFRASKPDYRNCWWWLRSPGANSDHALCVSGGGGLDDYGYIVDDNRRAVRPALWINLKS